MTSGILLLTVAVTLVGFIIAAGKTEARHASSSSAVVAEALMILPFAGVFFGQHYQLAGRVWVLCFLGGTLLLAAILFLLAAKQFQRETVLFKWK